jgi:hypothetical protein
MMDAIRSCLTRLGELTATPAAFGVFVVYFCLWFLFEQRSGRDPKHSAGFQREVSC